MHHDGLEIGLGHTVLRDMTHTLLRVLLDNDAVFSGMPIPELAEVPYLDPPLSITQRATIEATR
jgi:hypothetical protein